MMKIQVLCVGRLKEKFYLEAAREYEKRLAACCKLQILELPEERLPEEPSQAQIEAALTREGQRLLSKIPKGARIAALCVEGEALSSPQLAAKLAAWGVGGSSQVCFLLGSSYGMAPEVKARAELRLSMSPMTFPHHLARVMLLEQLYRAFQINGGTRYHK